MPDQMVMARVVGRSDKGLVVAPLDTKPHPLTCWCRKPEVVAEALRGTPPVRR